MRSENLTSDAAHELEVVDAVVRGGGHARPEDAALTDFALLVRNARPVPDHGTAARLDEQLTGDRSVRQSYRRPLLSAVAACAVVLVVGAVALSGQNVETGGSPAPQQETAGPLRAPGSAVSDSRAAGKLEFQQKSLPLADQTPGSAATVADSRDVAREARLTLATTGARMERLSDQVVETVDRARGYVANSNVRTAPGDRGRAEFRLMLSAATFQQTFADLSKLAHVRSRSQSTEDITTEFNAARRSLRQRQDRVDQLEAKLAAAESPAVKAALRRDLARAKFAERQAQQRIRVNHTRTEFVPVDLKIVADSTAASADRGAIGKAVDKSAEILTAIAAVLIVFFAVAIPLCVAVGLGLFGYRRWHRVRAERAIGSAAAQPE